MTEKLLTIGDVAERLQISKPYAGRLVARGDITPTRIGRAVRVTEQALADFVAARTQPSRRSRRGTAA